MKPKIAITLLVGLPILALARPDLYKESEDFKFSRTSSDEGSKAGFYESQRGNMGGNFEKSYNMDNLAQRQLDDLAVRVGSNGQVSTNLNTGSTFGLASTSGTEYGAALNGHVASSGSNSNIGSRGQLQTGYGGSSGSNYNGESSASNYNGGSSASNYNRQSSQSSNLNRYSTYNRNAASGASLQSGNGYDSNGASSNLELEQGNLQHHAAINQGNDYGRTNGQHHISIDQGRTNSQHYASIDQGNDYGRTNGQHQISLDQGRTNSQHHASIDQGNDYGRTNGQQYYYDAATGQYIQQSSRGQSSFGATSGQAVQGAQLSSLDRPLIVRPIKVKIVPGTIVTLPINAQALNVDSVNQHSSQQSQSQLSSNTNREYGAAGYGDSHNYNDAQLSHLQPTTRPKSYQSSYNYRKQWESHSATPVVANVAPQVTIPVVVPTGAISSDSLQSSNTRLNSGSGSVRYSSGSRVASAGQQHGATQYSNRNSYSGGDNQLELDALASTNVNHASQSANVNSLSSATADQQSYTGMDQVASGSPGYTNTNPKNYQSSYSYHKAWERHGTPYVIKPAISADGTVDLNSNQALLDAAAQLSQTQQSSYRSQASTAGSSGTNSRYQQGGNLCDINCYNAYLRDNQNNLGSDNYRSKRSYNNYQYMNSQKYHPAGDSEEDKDLGQQQLQSFNQEFDGGGQHAEDFGQQIDVGQQVDDFGQANIPVETNQGNLLYIGFNENTTPKNVINKPDIQYSLLFSKPSFQLNSDQESTTIKNLMHSHRHNPHLWNQHTYGTQHNTFMAQQNQILQKQNEDIHKQFLEFDKIAKEIEESLKFTPEHSPKSHHVNIGLTQHPTLYQFPYQEFSHQTTFNGEFGHDRHIQDKHSFLHSHSQLDTDCKKHETFPTVSITEDDVLKRIDELQKQLGFGSFNLNKPVTPILTSHSTPTPKVSYTTILNTNRIKTPEEIEALSLTRNPEKPVAPLNNNQNPQMNFNSINSGTQKQDFDQQEDVGQDFGQKTEDIGQKTQDFGQKVEDIGQESQDFGQKVEDLEQELQDFGQKVEDIGQKPQVFEQKVEDIQPQDFGQKVEDIGQQTQDFGQNVADIGQETQNVWPQMEDVGQQTQDFGQQQENIDQIQINNDLGLQLGIIRQQLHEPKDLRQKDENRNFIYHEQRTENKEISSYKPDSRPTSIIVDNNKQNKEIVQVHKDSEEELQDLGQETMDFGQSPVVFGQSQINIEQNPIEFGQSQNKVNVQVETEVSTEESQDAGQESVDFGQSQMDFGQSQMDFGQSQMGFGQSHNLIGTGQSQTTLSQSPNNVNFQVHKNEPEEESQDLGQESMDFGQSQIDFGQSQLDFGKSQVDIRHSQIDLDQSQIDVGKTQVNIGQNQINISPSDLDFGQIQVDVGQSPTDFGQSEVDIGQSQLGFDQSQVDFGQSQTKVDNGQNTDDFVQAQLNLGQQAEGFDQSSSGGLHLKYGYNEPKHNYGMPLQVTIGEQTKQEVNNEDKYKNLEIDESAAPKEEVVTIKPGFFKNLGNKISTGFNKVFG